eukprot:1392165-Amorphochlora_amoeboformis.AAC.2
MLSDTREDSTGVASRRKSPRKLKKSKKTNRKRKSAQGTTKEAAAEKKVADIDGAFLYSNRQRSRLRKKNRTGVDVGALEELELDRKHLDLRPLDCETWTR